MDKYLSSSKEDENKDDVKLENVINDQLKSTVLSITFKEIFSEEGTLHLSYNSSFLPKRLADSLLRYCENNIDYYEGELTKVHVFNKWHQIPRKQVAYGDPGLSYSFSGILLPARKWTKTLEILKDCVCKAAKCDFNFVLINRYADGNDYISEHKDDEKDLDKTAPIASLSLGQSREFVLRHEDRHKRSVTDKTPENVKINLDNGSLLLMQPPTNRHWYHSIPKRKRSSCVRINFTFRKLIR